jgi:hypothetical protein
MFFKALIMFAVLAAFRLVMATAVGLPSIQQAQARFEDTPGVIYTVPGRNEKVALCHHQGGPLE